jgi:hypothetical protein
VRAELVAASTLSSASGSGATIDKHRKVLDPIAPATTEELASDRTLGFDSED